MTISRFTTVWTARSRWLSISWSWSIAWLGSSIAVRPARKRPSELIIPVNLYPVLAKAGDEVAELDLLVVLLHDLGNDILELLLEAGQSIGVVALSRLSFAVNALFDTLDSSFTLSDQVLEPDVVFTLDAADSLVELIAETGQEFLVISLYILDAGLMRALNRTNDLVHIVQVICWSVSLWTLRIFGSLWGAIGTRALRLAVRTWALRWAV